MVASLALCAVSVLCAASYHLSDKGWVQGAAKCGYFVAMVLLTSLVVSNLTGGS